MSNVRLESVRKVYEDGRVAVAGASFEVAAGELMVLVGPSGCGKSTLLRMIAGIEEITSGTLSIGGRVVNDLAPKDRDIAMVFQNYALYPHMSVAENMGFGLRLARRPAAEIDRRVRAAAARLGLTELLQLRPRVLSGGQRQRVALGRALVREPKVFLLDEPLSNLDAKLRLAMRTEIARLQRELGATMIYVTHDQIEAMTLGHRIVVLEAGQVQQIDTPMGLYDRPANLFVAGFLGSPAMNFVRGRVQRAHGLQLAFDAGVLPLGTSVPAAVAAGEGEWVAGLRPEHLRPADGDAAGADFGRVTARVELVEALGNELILNLRSGGVDLVARVPPRNAPEPGQSIALGFDPAHLLFFDAASGARVS